MAEFYRKKKKVCVMCTGKDVNYKDVETLKKYINEKGKILPRRCNWYLCLSSKTYCWTN